MRQVEPREAAAQISRVSPRLRPGGSKVRSATSNLLTANPPLVKMSVLARLAGVPAATIKHYLREGLLPQAERRTSKNMAFYDARVAERIKRIKELQREHFLPLKVIKSLLDGDAEPNDDAVAAGAIRNALTSMAQTDARTRDELLASGMPEEELALFEGLGLVTTTTIEGRDVYSGDDLALLRVLGNARREGITPKMLPADTLGPYVSAIGALAKIELQMFREGILPRAKGDLARLTDVATRLSEQLVVLLRRKVLLPALQEIVEEEAGKKSPRATSSRTKNPRTRALTGAKR